MNKIICVGKNYLEHAVELGDKVPEMPVIFLKPAGLAVSAGASGDKLELTIPAHITELHHECEIVVRVGNDGESLTKETATKFVDAVTLGLDMTWRDRQAELKKNGHPWELAKVFRDCAVVGPFVSVKDFSDFQDEEFRFFVNGKLRQSGKANEMRLSVAECLSYISHYIPLHAGDFVFTGTPAGVGSIIAGDQGRLEWGKIKFSVQWVSHT